MLCSKDSCMWWCRFRPFPEEMCVFHFVVYVNGCASHTTNVSFSLSLSLSLSLFLSLPLSLSISLFCMMVSLGWRDVLLLLDFGDYKESVLLQPELGQVCDTVQCCNSFSKLCAGAYRFSWTISSSELAYENNNLMFWMRWWYTSVFFFSVFFWVLTLYGIVCFQGMVVLHILHVLPNLKCEIGLSNDHFLSLYAAMVGNGVDIS